MKKILQVTSLLARNGTETFIMNVYKHIDRKSMQFDFLVFTEDTDGYYEEAEGLGAHIYRLPSRRKGLVKYYESLDSFFREHANEYDAIHFNFCMLSTISPLYLAKKYNIPIRILHSHSSSWVDGLYNLILHKAFKPFAYRLTNHYLACSIPAKKWFYGSTLAEEKCIVVRNGIDTSLFEYNEGIRSLYRRKLGIAEGDLVLGHVGSFLPVKNHAFIVDVYNELLKQAPNTRLLLIGTGELKNNVIDNLKHKEILDKVIFLENRNDVNYLLQAMDVFIFPSLFEGLPFALIEAQCAGLKVFASDTISHESKMTDNLYFLSLSKGAKKWANEILRYRNYNRNNEAELIKRAGYSIETTVNFLKKLYNSI